LSDESIESQTLDALASQVQQSFSKQDHYKGKNDTPEKVMLIIQYYFR
jgi:hypothetical protein